MTIGERIKIRRKEMKLSQRDLAKLIGYADHSTITKIEAGKVDLPQSKIEQFAEVLNVSIPYIMGWQEVQKKNDTLTDIVLKLRSDDELLSLVNNITQLNPEQLASVKQVVNVMLKG